MYDRYTQAQMDKLFKEFVIDKELESYSSGEENKEDLLQEAINEEINYESLALKAESVYKNLSIEQIAEFPSLKGLETTVRNDHKAVKKQQKPAKVNNRGRVC